MELPSTGSGVSSDQNREEAARDGIRAALQEYIAAAKQKRPYGVLIYEEIGHVVMELMPKQGRVDRTELIRNAADALDFSDAAYKRIDESIRRLEELKKVCTDSKSVWRRAP